MGESVDLNDIISYAIQVPYRISNHLRFGALRNAST
jgi:hypothetical protein